MRFATVRPELERRLTLVGLSHDVLGMYPIELSGGMKQRTVMVLSTLLNPALLIADEITSALDVSSQKAVAETLVEFRDRGYVKSMIVITHDLAILYQVADTILVMYAGKLAEKAPAEVIIESPLHPYTQLLISSLPEVGVTYEEKRLTGIPGRPPPLLDPPTGCRFRDRCPFAFDKCVEEPPFLEVEPEPLRRVLEGGLQPDAAARARHQALQGRHLRRQGAGRGARRLLRAAARRGRLAHRRERQRQDHRREDDPAPDARSPPAQSRSTASTCRAQARPRQGLLPAACRGSSRTRSARYNPIFKADRVFSMLRGAYFPRLSGADWGRKLDASLEAVAWTPARCWTSTPTSSAAVSSNAC